MRDGTGEEPRGYCSRGLINWSADPISSYYQEEIATSSVG